MKGESYAGRIAQVMVKTGFHFKCDGKRSHYLIPSHSSPQHAATALLTCSSSNRQSILPAGLCTCCSFYLELSGPIFGQASLPHLTQVSTQTSLSPDTYGRPVTSCYCAVGLSRALITPGFMQFLTTFVLPHIRKFHADRAVVSFYSHIHLQPVQ